MNNAVRSLKKNDQSPVRKVHPANASKSKTPQNRTIFIEYFILDEQQRPVTSYTQAFVSIEEYKLFYTKAKADPRVAMNIMTYDPSHDVDRKVTLDSQLFLAPRNWPT